MARAIDSEVAYQFLTEQLVKETGAFSKGVNKGLNIARSAMRNPDAIPTLTQPNEGVKDKTVPTNGPLTLEELRMMAEPTPVWWDWVQGWVLARKGMIISWNGVYYNFEEVKGNFYRRPPEGEEEENDVIEITENL